MSLRSGAAGAGGGRAGLCPTRLQPSRAVGAAEAVDRGVTWPVMPTERGCSSLKGSVALHTSVEARDVYNFHITVNHLTKHRLLVPQVL